MQIRCESAAVVPSSSPLWRSSRSCMRRRLSARALSLIVRAADLGGQAEAFANDTGTGGDHPAASHGADAARRRARASSTNRGRCQPDAAPAAGHPLDGHRGTATARARQRPGRQRRARHDDGPAGPAAVPGQPAVVRRDRGRRLRGWPAALPGARRQSGRRRSQLCGRPLDRRGGPPAGPRPGGVRRLIRRAWGPSACAQYLSTGEAPQVEGIATHPPHDYGVAVILYGLADHMVPAEQVAPLREGVRTFLLASQLTLVDMNQANATFAKAREMAKALPEPRATLLTYVNDRNVDEARPCARASPGQAGAESPAGSPERAPRYRARLSTSCTAMATRSSPRRNRRCSVSSCASMGSMRTCC